MKIRPASLIPFLLLLLTSCIENEATANYPFLQKENENITLLFSDDSTLYEEGNYYDALLDVKKKHPEKIRSFNIIHSSDHDLISHYEIRKYPTLLVIHNENERLRVEGALKTQDILMLLEQALVK